MNAYMDYPTRLVPPGMPAHKGIFRNPLVVITIAVLVLLAIVGGIVWFYYSHTQQSKALLPKGDQLLFVLPSAGLSQQYSFNPDTSKVSPVVVPGYESDTVTDSLRDGSVGFYILQNKDSDTSTIVTAKIDSNDKLSSVTPLTTSTTNKFDMSYDPSTHTLAYDAVVSPKTATFIDMKITTLNVSTKVEKVIGIGSNPIILTGAHTVLATIVASIEAIPTQQMGTTSAAKIILSEGADGPVAVSADSKTLAVYETRIKGIQIYNITTPFNPKFVRLETAPFIPSAMVFSGTDLLLVGRSATSAMMSAIGYAGDKSAVGTFSMPVIPNEIPGEIQKITLSHA